MSLLLVQFQFKITLLVIAYTYFRTRNENNRKQYGKKMSNPNKQLGCNMDL
jgi:hypothetical protein